ncbi:hypothetical protein [Spiroplasma culicicola]|uniref:Uncharacterized protein n=1 Tax=Spiroplasma culicicola AES-1 TaxID=1276246 RepID=W6A7L6_9MOLU|nr:hypothetical protein [Spiroplasma culicicola]AHI52977.1 hypothetical protein SCULI_v1c06360 [Spiroplasma culicicola AES-1]
MLERILNKEEKKIFSKKNLRKIRKEDFFTYLEMEEALLESLKVRYATDGNDNPITLSEIEKQERFVQRLNEYYYEVVLIDPKNGKDPMFSLEKEVNKIVKPLERIQRRGFK